MASLLNVDPKRADDQFYRYKMPRVQTKVESGGNGIKTVIPNIEGIAQALNRDVQLPMKYMGQHIGSSAKLKDSKWMLMGKVEREEVQKLIFEFIEKFVLCKECRNPETIVQVDESKNIWLNCKACSRVTGVDPKDKLCALIIKTEQPVTIIQGKKKSKDVKSKDQKEEEIFNKQARQVQDGDIIVDESPEKPNPIVVLKGFIAQEGKTENEIVHHVFELKQDYGLNDRHVVSLVFEALFDENIAKQIGPRAKLMKRVLKADTERDLIINLMCLCKEVASLNTKFPILLKTFYDSDVLSEKAILEWFEESKSSKLLKREEQLAYKDKCKPFITWLKEADDEDDEEDEDEEDA